VHLIFPLLAAILFAVASLFFKQGYTRGATALQTFHWSNLVGLVVFLPLWIGGDPIALADLWHPALVSLLILMAGGLMFASIAVADVSLATPLMGTKVIFVALAQVMITSEVLTARLWIACVLTALGILLIGYKDLRNGKGGWRGVVYAIGSALCFGVADVFMQQWAPLYGKFAFLGAVAVLIGIASALVLTQQGWGRIRLPRATLKPVIIGGGVLASQAMMMGYALGFFHDAARVNVVYGSRGLWSLLLVWWLGSRFQNRERESNRDAFRWRVAGTLFVTSAIVLAILGR
jgi:drug/metabolite transporter (DMT)-like permease